MTVEIISDVGDDQRAEALAILRKIASAAATRHPDLDPPNDDVAAETPGDVLLLAVHNGQSVGAALAVLQPGGVAWVWPPVVRDSAAPDHTADALLSELCLRIDAAGIQLAQCLLEQHEVAEAAGLRRHAFARLTEMVYLERLLNEQPVPSPCRLTEIAYQPGANDGRFGEVLEATCVGTLDCPELNGWRSGREALAAHRGAGEFDPRLWRLYNDGLRDAGLLLLADHPEMRAWEVVYVGIVPAARRRGYARAMLLAALTDAVAASREAILLAVDVRNRWARSLYDSLGFFELMRRDVYVRRGP